MKAHNYALLLLAVPGPVSAQSTREESGAVPAGLVGIAPDETGAHAKTRHATHFVGERTTPQIGMSVEVEDAARGPISAAGKATAGSASYAMSLVNVRPDWVKGDLTGEADGLSVFVRQSRGDTAAILANVAVRDGFATTLESLTYSVDSQNRQQRAVRTQLGVVNPRDGSEYGLAILAERGMGLSAGIRVAASPPGSWKRYLEAVDNSGKVVAAIAGDDGGMESNNFRPQQDLSGTLGAHDRRFSATYSALMVLAPIPFGQLPICYNGAGAGTLAYVGDARDSVKRWHQQIVSGGGSQSVYVQCDGTQWLAF
ncbi:hypothetical protein [Novosphingobium sp.]|uniref:hypothetical protein n=1 Tax=Novosphingobium sp. TaxID=1874826 RepID=UPI003D0FCE82